MARLFHELVLRYLLRHRFIAVLDILGVAIGVAVYVAIQASNGSATRAFASGLDLTTGRSHLEVRGPGQGVPESLFPDLARQPGVAAVTPVVEGYVTLPERPGSYLHVVGVDPFSSAPFATVGDRITAVPDLDLEKWLGAPGQIILHERFADRAGLKRGDVVTVERDSRRENLRVAGVLPARAVGPDAPPSLALMDVGWAREFFGGDGLTSIQVRLDDPGRAEEIARELRERLDPGLTVEAPRTRSLQVQRMLDGFQLNLTALSMVSALVGVFLIYNTVSASVVRRRREIGILRSTGAGPHQIFILFLAEGLLLGLPGVLLGLPLGLFLAGALVGAVTETISSHYVLIDVARVVVPPGHLWFAVAYGMGASLAGAWLPAREAARMNPLEALRPHRHVRSSGGGPLRLLGLGGLAGVCSAGTAWLALSHGPPWWSFAACFFLVVGFALATPWLSGRLARVLAHSLARVPRLVLWRVAVENFERSWHRSAVTVAALMTALSMTIGVSIMVSSFRETVAQWVRQSMKADLYVTPAANEVIGFESFFPDGFVEALERHPSVAQVETYRQVMVQIPGRPPFRLAAVGSPDTESLRFTGGSPRRRLEAWNQPGNALATEPLARRLGLAEGDVLTIPSPSGPIELKIAGIYHDYSDDRGKLAVPREQFARWWGDDRVHSVAVTLRPGADADALREEVGGNLELAWLSNADLRQRVFDVFDKTFAVTLVLRSVAVIVAILGVSLALAILVMERTREVGILRALGASRHQIQRLYLAEGAVIGLAGSLIGGACGIGMSTILIRVVNPSFFGWSIELNFRWTELVMTPLWVIPVAVVAALIPAARAARIPLGTAVRTD